MSEVKVNKISPRTNCGTTQLGDAGDTITVTGDLKSNSLKPATGTTLTLGASGDTITLAAGASQTGFGRTGTVDWDTTAKTTSFTAVSGNGYFVNTTSGAITVTLPATPSAGDIVSVKDYAQTFNTNNCTLARNGSNIEGTASDIVLNGQAESVTFVYVDSTKGWVLVGESLTQYGPQFVAATGGTVTTCGNFKIHVFTGPSTFCVSCAGNPAGSSTVEYLVVAIDRQFAIRQLEDFEVGTLEHSRDSRFRQHVLAAWRHHQRHHQAFDVSTPPPFDKDWQPSLDAMEIMARSGVDEEFIDSVRPEFILYWRERGGPPREVNSKFIGWVRSRWTRFQAGLGHSTEPRPMTAGWQPSEQVFEVLAMSGIERDYALGRLPEFRVFWCDAGELQTSWNSKFLQHVKHQWRWDQGRQHDNDQRRGSAGDKRRTRDLGIADILGNTGWAD